MTATARVDPLVAPLRSRNRPLAAQRRAQAVELAVQGFTYETIAAKIGIAHRGTVHRMVHQAIRERAARGVEELRRVNYDRLEALVLTLWPEVERGDIKAIAAALRVITAEIRLFQLDDVAKRTTGGPKTVVQPDSTRRPRFEQGEDRRVRGFKPIRYDRDPPVVWRSSACVMTKVPVPQG